MVRRWLDETFDSGPALMPTDPQRRAEAQKVLARGTGRFNGAGISFLAGDGRRVTPDAPHGRGVGAALKHASAGGALVPHGGRTSLQSVRNRAVACACQLR